MVKVFMARAAQAIAELRTKDEGQTLVEYVLVTGLVSVALIGALLALGVSLNGFYDVIVANL